jgi:acyl-coenzyme A synthetase/AMP-(fatty) acid ligase
MKSLWEWVSRPGASGRGEFHGIEARVRLEQLAHASTLGDRMEELRGRSVLIATREQLPTALALLELDGVARRFVLCTPDVTTEQLARIAQTAEADALLLDAERAGAAPAGLKTYVPSVLPTPTRVNRQPSAPSEWILLTSGTTGAPKLVVHTLSSLGGTLPQQSSAPCVWSTFYDIRRYGGLQIYLRAVLSGVPLVLSSASESLHDFLTRAAAAGVTHISGTPSHWRRALMSGDATLISPSYVRLSGEVADQAVLDRLRATYPQARIAHAFASTEAGVAFEVNDGLAGFPAELIDAPRAHVEIKIEGGTLRIRSGRNAARYLGETDGAIIGADGFVDTGDLVELIEGRYHFRGRRGGVINVGGLKVFPEEIEAVLNSDPRVRMSLVRARRNPITGALVMAEIVLRDAAGSADSAGAEALRLELLERCRKQLAAYKVPALIRFVPALALTAGGKLVRPEEGEFARGGSRA